MRNELSDMQQRADQLADEVRTARSLHRRALSCDGARARRHAYLLTESGLQHIHVHTNEKHEHERQVEMEDPELI